MLEGGTMNRYYIEVHYRVTPADAVDEHTDAVMDALDDESTLIDPDLGANLHDGWVEVYAAVDGKDEASALSQGLTAIKSAVHRTEASSWETDLDNIRVTVRTTGSESDMVDYQLSTQSVVTAPPPGARAYDEPVRVPEPLADEDELIGISRALPPSRRTLLLYVARALRDPEAALPLLPHQREAPVPVAVTRLEPGKAARRRARERQEPSKPTS